MSEQKHTELPWEVQPGFLTIYAIPSGGTQAIAKTLYSDPHNALSPCVPLAEAEANAELILRAVNSHQALVAALEAYQAFHHRIFCTGYPLEQHGKPISHTDLNEAHRLAEIALLLARGESQ